jgi:hypothetical protein
MNPPTSVRASVSPRFENLMTRSGSVPWSPAPLNAPQYEKTSVDPLSANHSFTKSSDAWLNNNAYTKSSDIWSNNHNMQSKTSDIWSPRNTFIKPAESTMISNNSSNAQMIKRFENEKKIYRIKSNFYFSLVRIKHVVVLLIDVHLVVNLVYLVLLLDF